ncbi:hypothetical protein [Stenotrophomonas humi]
MTAPNAETLTRPEAIATDVPVPPVRTVTYLFLTGTWVAANVRSSSEKNIKIPYEVAFDGVIQDRAPDWPRRIIGGTAFTIRVPVGVEVSLFLNTDSLVGARMHPVYAVTPDENDVHVTIRETRGARLETLAEAVLARTAVDERSGRRIDYYDAPLHGNIWARISRVYTSEAAAETLPADADAAIRDAVVSIYRGLDRAQLEIQIGNPPVQTISATFVDSENPRVNISNYSFLRDGLPRVHPLGFFALLDAARVAGATVVNLTSCWRPSLGSIAHRAGIGLDVNIIADDAGSVRINRSELIGGMPTPWVSDAEPHLHRRRGEDRGAWTAEVERNKPPLFQAFRSALEASQHVRQIFDPWYLDANSRDEVPATYNEQNNANAMLHNNHLHITLNIPELL